MKHKVTHALLLGFILCFTITGLAGDKSGEQINWQVISGGGQIGGTSTSYVLSGTVAQTAVGGGGSTNYLLKHGFWQNTGGGTSCCDMPGDASDNGAVNILDITYLIAYLYQSGPAPICLYEGDASGNCTINILDITFLIAYLYQSGPAPICASSCPGW